MYLHIVEFILKDLPTFGEEGSPRTCDTAHNTVIRNPNQSLNNDVFSFSSQHQPSRRCSTTSIDGTGKGAPAVDSGAVGLVNAGAAKG